MGDRSKKEVLLIGGSGFIGRALGEVLARKGYHLRLLTRSAKKVLLPFPCHTFQWDGKVIPRESVLGAQVVINLVGESVAGRRWTSSYKEQLRNSRINTAKNLVRTILSLSEKPELVLQTSAVGYYGLEARKENCHEESAPGKDFLAQLCQDWERELEPLKDTVRVCIPRLGVVLGWGGGAFAKLWDIYANGLGAMLGSGKQWMNYVHLADVVNFFVTAIEKQKYHGVFNLVAPGNVSQKAFHEELSRRSASLSFMRSPSLALKVVLGEAAKLMTESPFVEPRKLQELGFEFSHKDLESSFSDLLDKRFDPRANHYRAKIWLPTTLEKMWEFSSSAHNLERITPPWLKFKVKSLSSDEIKKNTIIKYSLRLKGIPFYWRTRITEWEPNTLFADNQESGPYKLWYHRHIFTELAGGVLAEDQVDFRLPLFPLSIPFFLLIKSDVEKIFAYRSKTLNEIFYEN